MAPVTNSTTQYPSSGNSSSNHFTVSGPTVFWALLALALNAMGQECSSAQIIFGFGSMKQGFLMPWLSSPAFCVADIIVDCYQMVHALCMVKKEPLHTVESTRTSSHVAEINTATLVRILLVVFGVIPQAVRLYGMSGIPQVQIFATIYLAASLVRLLKTRFPALAKENAKSQGESHGFLGFSKSMAGMVLVVVHLTAFASSWAIYSSYFTHKIAQGTLTADYIMDILRWTLIACTVILLTVILLWTVNILFDLHRGFQSFRPVYLAVPILIFALFIRWMVWALDNSPVHVIDYNVCTRLDPYLLAAITGSFLLARLLRLLQTNSNHDQQPSNDLVFELSSVNNDTANDEQPSNDLVFELSSVNNDTANDEQPSHQSGAELSSVNNNTANDQQLNHDSETDPTPLSNEEINYQLGLFSRLCFFLLGWRYPALAQGELPITPTGSSNPDARLIRDLTDLAMQHPVIKLIFYVNQSTTLFFAGSIDEYSSIFSWNRLPHTTTRDIREFRSGPLDSAAKCRGIALTCGDFIRMLPSAVMMVLPRIASAIPTRLNPESAIIVISANGETSLQSNTIRSDRIQRGIVMTTATGRRRSRGGAYRRNQTQDAANQSTIVIGDTDRIKYAFRYARNERRYLQPLFDLMLIGSLCCLHSLLLTFAIINAMCDLGRPVPMLQHIRRLFNKHITTNVDLAFAFFNLITAGIWYFCLYDETGTSKPEWENWLG